MTIPSCPVVERLRRDFPERNIRVLYGSGRIATNDKVAKLARLVSEAAHEVVVISDSDVRVAAGLSAGRGRAAGRSEGRRSDVFLCPYRRQDVHRAPADHRHDVRFLCRYFSGMAAGRSEVRARADHRHHALPAGRIRRLSENRESPGGRSCWSGRLIAEQGYDVELLPLSREHGRRLSIHARSAAQAPALDRGDAPHAAVGALRTAADAGIAVVAGGGRGCSIGGDRLRLSWALTSYCGSR